MYYLSADCQQSSEVWHLMGGQGSVTFVAPLQNKCTMYKSVCRAQGKDCEEVQIMRVSRPSFWPI